MAPGPTLDAGRCWPHMAVHWRPQMPAPVRLTDFSTCEVRRCSTTLYYGSLTKQKSRSSSAMTTHFGCWSDVILKCLTAIELAVPSPHACSASEYIWPHLLGAAAGFCLSCASRGGTGACCAMALGVSLGIEEETEQLFLSLSAELHCAESHFQLATW